MSNWLLWSTIDEAAKSWGDHPQLRSGADANYTRVTSDAIQSRRAAHPTDCEPTNYGIRNRIKLLGMF